MDTLRVTNFRSIADSGVIKLNDINFFLGKNSSGKSSLLRIFPLFQRSSKHELREPILWLDEDYDYGSFLNTLNRKALENDRKIHFVFTWDIQSQESVNFLKGQKKMSVNIEVAGKMGSSVIDKLQIGFGAIIVNIEENNEGVLLCYLNNQKIDWGQRVWDYAVSGILPNTKQQGVSSELDDFYNFNKMIIDKLPQLGNVYKKMLTMDILSIETANKNVDNLLSFASQSKFGKKDRENLVNRILTMNIMELLLYVDKNLREYFEKVAYIAPLRYNYSRYIRDYGFAINKIDSSGKNVIEYISSLTQLELKALNKFLTKTINITVKKKGNDNAELLIVDEDDEEYNIIDVGYGYSQILPIAIMLWDVASRNDNEHKKVMECERTIVIEQPEVHLHPSMQSNLATLFVETLLEADRNKHKVKLIIETHSPNLINGMSNYISDYKNFIVGAIDKDLHVISPDRISIYLFNKKEGLTTIKSTGFNEDGQIMEWPLGFLN